MLRHYYNHAILSLSKYPRLTKSLISYYFILHLSNFEKQLPQTPDIIHETQLLSVLNTCTLNLKTYKNR